jgi:hypothetical protein
MLTPSLGMEETGVERLCPVGDSLFLIDCQTGASQVEHKDGSHWAPH